MFSTPPSLDRVFRDRPRDRDDRHNHDALLAAHAVGLAGVAGFLGLLIAGSLIASAATPLRALALVWFVVFGVWHVWISAKIR